MIPRPIATIDFETYSEAGAEWDAEKQRFVPPLGATRRGLPAVGSANYARHPSTEVLVASYRIPGDRPQRWVPGQPAPIDLFTWIESGGLIEAHNNMFERQIWHHVCERLYSWPPVPAEQWRCSMATARVNNLPGALDNLGDVLKLPTRKDKDGKRLLDKFSQPRNPTKSDPRTRIRPADDPEDAERLYAYCDRDVEVEEAASALMPPMTPDELAFWQIDQDINWRGVAIDRESVRNCIAVMEECLDTYVAECMQITGGTGPSQVQKLLGWVAAHGVYPGSLDDESVTYQLSVVDLHPDVRRVLEIRSLTSSASVKKLYAIERETADDDRLRNLYNHHGARTGRPTGMGPQPTNLPKAGPDLYWDSTGRPFGRHHTVSPWTGEPVEVCEKTVWEPRAVDYALEALATRSHETVEYLFGDSLLTISGCVRGMFCAGPGHDLISSDYTAIEAVVAAAASGEQWRLETFRAGRDIYLEGASKITGISYDDYVRYSEERRKPGEKKGPPHPDRQKVGKISELALGFGGWIGALRAFGAEGEDDELKRLILAWRDASPNIVEMWGGQGRGFPGSYRYVPELYGLEGAMIGAIQSPGLETNYRGVRFVMRGDSVYMRLLSGREIRYCEPRLTPNDRRAGELAITYMTWNSNPKMGALGWVPMSTYSGRLFENFVQGTAHDIQRFGIVNLTKAGYPIVLHVYDENVSEVPEGFGSIEEYERIMSTMPPWAEGWPIGAAGGWRGKRYRKG